MKEIAIRCCLRAKQFHAFLRTFVNEKQKPIDISGTKIFASIYCKSSRPVSHAPEWHGGRNDIPLIPLLLAFAVDKFPIHFGMRGTAFEEGISR